MLRVERGAFALLANLADTPARVPLGDVMLASEALARGDELPPLGCALVRAHASRAEHR